MRLRSRLDRLERLAPATGAEEAPPPVEIWLPFNGRCDPPGRYPCPGSNAILVIYEAEAPAGEAGACGPACGSSV